MIPFVMSRWLVALREERRFRRGDETRGIGSRLWRSLVFGLSHLTVGIPVGAAIGIGVSGFCFSHVYLRRWRKSASRHESVLDAVRVHVAYDLLVAGLVFVALIIEAEAKLGSLGS